MYFYLYSNCILTKGYRNSSIIDLQRKEVYIIDGNYSKILENNGAHIDYFVKNVGAADLRGIRELWFFLKKNDLAFRSNSPVDIKELSSDYHLPFAFSNSIIDYDNLTLFSTSVSALSRIKCSYLQIRFFTKIQPKELKEILRILHYEGLNILSVELVFSHFYKNFETILKKQEKIVSVFYFNAFEDSTKILNNIYFGSFRKHFVSEKSCGNVSVDNFNIHLKSYTESINCNSCLSHKISIDRKGNIKNCPSMSDVFGNITHTTLEEASSHDDFEKYWSVTKDHIEVCKDCEFRYICTDCRAYTERTHTVEGLDFSKPLKCGYSPYTGEWEQWSTSPLKKKAIQFYGMHEFIKNNAN